jgi:uncharacterized membrane protein
LAKVTVRHGRLSYYSSVLMMLLGAYTFLFVSGFLGLILIAIGALMYRYYRRAAKQPEVERPSASGASI